MTAHETLGRLLGLEGGARGVAAQIGADRRMVQRWAAGREIPDAWEVQIGNTYRRILRERLERRL